MWMCTIFISTWGTIKIVNRWCHVRFAVASAFDQMCVCLVLWCLYVVFTFDGHGVRLHLEQPMVQVWYFKQQWWWLLTLSVGCVLLLGRSERGDAADAGLASDYLGTLCPDLVISLLQYVVLAPEHTCLRVLASIQTASFDAAFSERACLLWKLFVHCDMYIHRVRSIIILHMPSEKVGAKESLQEALMLLLKHRPDAPMNVLISFFQSKLTSVPHVTLAYRQFREFDVLPFSTWLHHGELKMWRPQKILEGRIYVQLCCVEIQLLACSTLFTFHR